MRDALLMSNGGSTVITIVFQQLKLFLLREEFQVWHLKVKQPLIFANARHNIEHELVEAHSASLGHRIGTRSTSIAGRMLGETLGLDQAIRLKPSEQRVECASADLLPRPD